MRRHRLLASLLFLLLAVPLALGQSKMLARRIDRILAADEISRGMWGIDVVSLSSGRTLYARNADKLFTPASNAKLFTTAAALALVGPDYRFQTTVESSATPDGNGRLNGDLVLVGHGDPNLSGRILPYHLRTERTDPPIHALEELADQLVQKGVKSVAGDLVADDSYYSFERYGEGWSQDDLVAEWGAPVSALSINDNVIFAGILPGDRVGGHAIVSFTPSTGYYQLDNRIITTPAGSGPRSIHVKRELGSKLLILWGSIPAGDSGASEALAIDDPADFAAMMFRTELEKRGIRIDGQTRSHHSDLAGQPPPAVPASAPVVLASYLSQPLGEDLQVTNKVSQNLHAELLLRLLGREKGTAGSGSVQGGLDVVRGFLVSAGLSPDDFIFYDGSGLSREDLVAPRAVVTLLSYASRQPWGAFYESTFPVGGVDGSLAERFKQDAGRQRIHAKTGSLKHINALSGYATTARGERIAFSILSNNQNAGSKPAVETIDKIVEAMLADR
jgi:D-alanyl-D-alanine carboxypeptidase/D-alanyl-D-alanine-endopeptidase (penicillin-binding protein 4)